MKQEQNVLAMEKAKVSLKEILKSWKLSLYTSTIGLLVGALPGAGGPVASFIAYNEAKRLVKEAGGSVRRGRGGRNRGE